MRTTNILVNLSADASRAKLEFFSLEPATPLRVTLRRGDAVLFNEAVTPDPNNGNRISAANSPPAARRRQADDRDRRRPRAHLGHGRDQIVPHVPDLARSAACFTRSGSAAMVTPARSCSSTITMRESRPSQPRLQASIISE